MKAVFGVLSLLIVLVIVGSIVKKQLHAVDGTATRLNGAAADAGASFPAIEPGGGTTPQQAHNLEQQFKDATQKALQQGAARDAGASQ